MSQPLTLDILAGRCANVATAALGMFRAAESPLIADEPLVAAIYQAAARTTLFDVPVEQMVELAREGLTPSAYGYLGVVIIRANETEATARRRWLVDRLPPLIARRAAEMVCEIERAAVYALMDETEEAPP